MTEAGSCSEAVEKVPQPMHIVCFILNIFIPGSGTIVSAFFGHGGVNGAALVFGLI